MNVLYGRTALFAATAGEYSSTPTKEDQKWLLPADNKPSLERVALGKALFFDPRLSSDGNLSCAGCHNPMFGWSDGLLTGKGNKSKVLGRALPATRRRISPTTISTISAWHPMTVKRDNTHEFFRRSHA